MGLDVIAYSHLHHLGRHTDEWCQDETHIRAYAYDCFPASFRGIPILSTEKKGGYAFIEGGCYGRSDRTVTYGFHVGSYGAYNNWRVDLARQFNPAGLITGDNGVPELTEPDPTRPFYELIWFADNEGTIGPEAAADLLVDFRDHAEKYDPAFNWREPPVQAYRHWMRAFELAADGGLVAFR